MIKSLAAALVLLAGPVSAGEKPLKIATVDMQRLFAGYHRAVAAQKESHVEMARLKKQDNDRLARIREIEVELEAFRKQAEDPVLAESKRVKLQQQWSDRRQEGVALERERRDFVESRRRNLNERMLRQMGELIAEIRGHVTEVARTEDYDYVFDSSAQSLNHVPFLIAKHEADDLTEALLTKLNAGAAEPKVEPAPK
jgi:outer membrane protein